jgi:uncharacterized damage-inducible protein DinB
VTPALSSVLFDEFAAFRSARAEQDALRGDIAEQSFVYTNNQGKDYVESAPVAFSHFFNHQTHHRGQVHVMLSQTPVAPPSLDLHRIVNP